MNLPHVKIAFANGELQAINTGSDGVLGIVATAAAVSGKFELNNPYQLRSMIDVANLGIVKGSVDNGRLYKALAEFYAEAGEGSELWIMGMDASIKVSEWFTPDGVTGIVPVQKLLDGAQGKINGIITCYNNTTAPTVLNGLGDDVITAANTAQSFAEDYTNRKYAPFFVILEGWGFSGTITDLPDLATYNYNRVAILIGDTEKQTQTGFTNYGSAVGILAGRISKNSVHVNIGRVLDGALSNTYAYVLDEAAELFDFEGLNDKGYLCFRFHQSKAGYYFSDDHLATAVEDDYHFLTRRRTIDKAYRVAYNILLDYLLDTVPINSDGSIQVPWIKSVEGSVENGIAARMTAHGELSADSTLVDDKGVKCFVDPNQDVAANGELAIVVQVRPYGYARYIEVKLGFTINNE